MNVAPMGAAEPVEHALKTKAAWQGSAPVNPSAMRTAAGQMGVMAYAAHVAKENPAKKALVCVFQIAAGTPAALMDAGTRVAPSICAGYAEETTPHAWDVMAFQTVDSSTTSAWYATETAHRVWDVTAFQTVDWCSTPAWYATETIPRVWDVTAFQTVDSSTMNAKFVMGTARHVWAATAFQTVDCPSTPVWFATETIRRVWDAMAFQTVE